LILSNLFCVLVYIRNNLQTTTLSYKLYWKDLKFRMKLTFKNRAFLSSFESEIRFPLKIRSVFRNPQRYYIVIKTVNIIQNIYFFQCCKAHTGTITTNRCTYIIHIERRGIKNTNNSDLQRFFKIWIFQPFSKRRENLLF